MAFPREHVSVSREALALKGEGQPLLFGSHQYDFARRLAEYCEEVPRVFRVA